VESVTGAADTVHRALEAFNRDGPEAILPFLHPDVVWDESELPARQPGVYHGHDGVRKLLEENAALWDGITVSVDELIEGEEGDVVAFIRVKGRGRNTGVEVELAVAEVWRLRDGKAGQVRLYLDRQEALEAAAVRS
jgi:ketosteroid isomerase-like protein